MITSDFFSMRSETDDVDLGVLFSASQDTLRLFGASYMRDKTTAGTLIILDQRGKTLATFDIWQNKWIDATDTGA